MKFSLFSIFTLAVLLAAATACDTEEDVTRDDNGSGCNTTDCYEACLEQGRDDGYCDGDLCMCGTPPGADGDTDADGDGDTDADGDGDTDADGDGDTDADGDGDTDADGDSTVERCDMDILFVFDTSGSMMDAVGHLTGVAFPQFADTLTNLDVVHSIHVGLTNHLTGMVDANGTQVDCSAMLNTGWPPTKAHDAFDCEEAPSVPCNFSTGKNFMEGPSDTLNDEFSCVGSVPCLQDVMMGEPTLQAGLDALVYPANAGFLREKALLVVVYITDEEDQSTMAIEAIRDGLIDIKGGDERFVVIVTIAGPLKGTAEINSVTHAKGCFSPDYGGTEETPKIMEFAALFGERGRHYDMCEDDLSTALDNALDQLETSCSEVGVVVK